MRTFKVQRHNESIWIIFKYAFQKINGLIFELFDIFVKELNFEPFQH